MATETDQTAGQLDVATVLRVLEMIQGYAVEARACVGAADERQDWEGALYAAIREQTATDLADSLVSLYRASLGLEEV